MFQKSRPDSVSITAWNKHESLETSFLSFGHFLLLCLAALWASLPFLVLLLPVGGIHRGPVSSCAPQQFVMPLQGSDRLFGRRENDGLYLFCWRFVLAGDLSAVSAVLLPRGTFLPRRRHSLPRRPLRLWKGSTAGLAATAKLCSLVKVFGEELPIVNFCRVT